MGFPIDSPGVAALAWVKLVLDDGNLEDAWLLTHEDLRLALVQSWILDQHQDMPSAEREDLAESLAQPREASSGNESEWLDFTSWRLKRWKQYVFSDVGADGKWGLLDTVEPVSADSVIVRLIQRHDDEDPRDELVIQPGEKRLAQAFVMREDAQGWSVIGIGRSIAFPGWPPSEVTVGE